MTASEPGFDRTVALLRRHHAGESAALDELLEDHLPFLQAHARRKLGAHLRRKEDPNDIVQSSVRELLEFGPRFEVANGAQFRALLAQLVHHKILHRDRWFKQKRRAMHREATQAGNSFVLLHLEASQTALGDRAAKAEEDARVRLALEFLEPKDREIIVRRALEDQSFTEIGEALGISADTATKRYHRAVPKLQRQMEELESGRALDASHLD